MESRPTGRPIQSRPTGRPTGRPTLQHARPIPRPPRRQQPRPIQQPRWTSPARSRILQPATAAPGRRHPILSLTSGAEPGREAPHFSLYGGRPLIRLSLATLAAICIMSTEGIAQCQTVQPECYSPRARVFGCGASRFTLRLNMPELLIEKPLKNGEIYQEPAQAPKAPPRVLPPSNCRGEDCYQPRRRRGGFFGIRIRLFG